MKFVPTAISRLVASNSLLASQHAPRVLFVAGVVGSVGSTVLACKATLRLEEVLNNAEADIADLKDKGQAAVNNTSLKYNTTDLKKDMVVIHVRHAQAVVRLYAPAVVVGALSIAALTKSHTLLTKRNTALTVAYAAAVEAYDEYRARVRKAVGDDKEREIHYGMEDRTFVEDTEKGPKKVTEKRATATGLYARFYDEFARNWQSDPELNRIFILNQQRYLNDRLHAKGHLFLNEAYDALGLDRSKAGQFVGWTLDGEGDGYVDFGIYDNPEQNARFVNGDEGAILLDFNVDGPIWKKIG